MQNIVNLIVLSSLYCLICCGYVLIYRSSRVLNLALGILLRGLITLTWTSQLWYPLKYLGMQNASHQIVKGAVVSTFGFIKIVSATLLYLGLFFCLKFTKWGQRMRAVGEKPLLASQRGIGLHKYYALSG